MNHEVCDFITTTKLISGSYVAQGRAALNARENQVQTLFSQRRLPATGWDDATIEMLIAECSCMDSNNFLQSVGVGEREGRVACPLVAKRHYRLAHGIGRSGDVAAEQPKAAGSSVLAKLTCLLVGDALRLAGLPEVAGRVTVLPIATGMAVLMTLLALKKMQTSEQRVVLWCRIDQKTCLKSMLAAGYKVRVIPGKLLGEQIVTDMQELESALQQEGLENIAAVATTSSCFAPRAADDVVAVAKFCQKHGIPHIINNAYGLQSASLCRAISSACRKGRVDAVVQSTDKNFMVPVGGAIIAAPKAPSSPLDLVEGVNKLYPGRAAMAPLLDVLLTLLHWGANGWKDVLHQREEAFKYATQRLTQVAESLGERLLSTPGNPISLAITLNNLACQGAAVASEPVQAMVPDAQICNGGTTNLDEELVRSLEDADGPLQQGSEGTLQQASDGSHCHTATTAATCTDQSAASNCTSSSRATDVRQTDALVHHNVMEGPCRDGTAGTCAGTTELAQGPSAGLQGQPKPAVLRQGSPQATPPRGAPEGPQPVPPRKERPSATLMGSMLFHRCVSGSRVVARGKHMTVGPHEFMGYGAHCDDYPHDYLALAAALGTTKNDIDTFAERFMSCYKRLLTDVYKCEQ